MVIVALTAPELQYVRAFEEREAGSKSSQPCEGLVDAACSGYLEMSVEACADLLAPTAARGQHTLQRAHKFVEGCQLHSWVVQQNTSRGLAPSPGEVL